MIFYYTHRERLHRCRDPQPKIDQATFNSVHICHIKGNAFFSLKEITNSTGSGINALYSVFHVFMKFWLLPSILVIFENTFSQNKHTCKRVFSSNKKVLFCSRLHLSAIVSLTCCLKKKYLMY